MNNNNNNNMDTIYTSSINTPSSPSLFTYLDEEVDFTFGAKLTPFLHPATLTHTDQVTTASYDLPVWMEGQIINLTPDNNLTETTIQQQPVTTTTTTTTTNILESTFAPLDESYCQTIKPEDMLVPLSEYQQPCTPASPNLEYPADVTLPNDIPSIVTPVKFIQTTPAEITLPKTIDSSTINPVKSIQTTPAEITLPKTINSSTITPVKSIHTSPANTIQSVHPVNPIIITPSSSLPTTYPAYPSPPQTPPNTTPPVPPKIIICRKVTAPTRKPKPIKVQFQIKPAVKTQPQVIVKVPQASYKPGIGQYREIGNQEQVVVVPERTESMGMKAPSGLSVVQYDRTRESLGAITEPCTQGLTAEDFIDDLVKMIDEDGGELQGLEGLDNIPFDATEMENCMEDLLTQLETDERTTETYTVQPATPPCVSESELSTSSFDSSCSALSPPITAYPTDSLSPTPSNLTASLTPSSPLSPAPSETTAYLPSPVPSAGSLSPSQSSESFFSVDEEWSPLDETHSYSKSRKVKASRRSGRRSKPYPEDRRERKKEQNKQAALRYRQKKKQEEDEMTEKIQFEEDRQRELRGKYDELKQELGYLKKMMREMFIARGLLTEEALKKATLEKKGKSK